jgi:hypothetical protein
MSIDPYRIICRLILLLSTLLVIAGLVLILGGCASQSTGTRTNHRVEKRQTQVVIPATADAPASIVPVTETTEIWEDEKSQVETKSGPDLEKIAPAVAAISGAVVSGGTAGGTGLLALLTTAGTGLIAYGAREVLARKDENKKSAEAQARIDRLREDRDRHQQRAEKYALQLPPQPVDDHA